MPRGKHAHDVVHRSDLRVQEAPTKEKGQELAFTCVVWSPLALGLWARRISLMLWRADFLAGIAREFVCGLF